MEHEKALSENEQYQTQLKIAQSLKEIEEKYSDTETKDENNKKDIKEKVK